MNPEPEVVPAPRMLTELRFSLAELLRELKAERAAGSFAMEKLNRHEIATIFRDRMRRERQPV
jgi:hypothetical protein